MDKGKIVSKLTTEEILFSIFPFFKKMKKNIFYFINLFFDLDKRTLCWLASNA